MTARAPVVLCHEILGTIVQLPPGYRGAPRTGDRVAVNPIVPCHGCPACQRGNYNVCKNLELLGIHRNGGFAEYTVARRTGSRLYTQAHFEAGVAMLAELARRFPLENMVAQILPLEQTAEGIELMASGKSAGKILVSCGG